MRFVLNFLVLLATLAYPFLWFYFHQDENFKWIAVLMAGVWLLRAFLQKQTIQKIISACIVVFFLLIVLFRTPDLMYWYPVAVNILMLLIFALSLLTKQSFVERIARIQHPDLDEEGVRYTRKVTKIWCGFFILNGLVVVLLINFQAWYWWTIYTGIISYILIAVLFIAEYLYRRFILKV